jgi:hypothetical protein
LKPSFTAFNLATLASLGTLLYLLLLDSRYFPACANAGTTLPVTTAATSADDTNAVLGFIFLTPSKGWFQAQLLALNF